MSETSSETQVEEVVEQQDVSGPTGAPMEDGVASPTVEAGSPLGTASGDPDSLDFSQLPGYSRSLLRVVLPVRVVLASKKEQLENVIELAAGSIIHFDKACDEMLHLQIDDHKVAVGEAIKVGDKFGFRVSHMVLPEEHFAKVKPKKKTG